VPPKEITSPSKAYDRFPDFAFDDDRTAEVDYAVRDIPFYPDFPSPGNDIILRFVFRNDDIFLED
jgi:hypothetical protein